MSLSLTQQAAYRAEADKLRAILARGATQISADGTTATYDLAAVRLRLREIERILTPSRRPRVSSIYLGGF